MSLTALEPSKPRTTLEIVRDGPDGRIIGYKEVMHIFMYYGRYYLGT